MYKLKHFYITIILFSFYFKLGNTKRRAEEECQKIVESYDPSMGNYIINGVEVPPGELPYMIAIALRLSFGLLFYCGAALVSKSCAVTAAHCVVLEWELPMAVRIGTTDISDRKWNPKTDYNITKIIVHPNYASNKKYFDIAIICFYPPEELPVNSHPICLESRSENPEVPLTIAGWGLTSWNGTTSSKLLKGTLKAYPNELCQESYENFPEELPNGITPNLLCAESPEGNQDTCKGDSGGPLVIANKNGTSRLVGVTAFGIGCATGHPGVYTRVSENLDWLEENIIWDN